MLAPRYLKLALKSHRTDGLTVGGTDGWMKFHPILKDFVSYRDHCPATIRDYAASKKQGKATADLMIPLGK